jgi:hypothetical protein
MRSGFRPLVVALPSLVLVVVWLLLVTGPVRASSPVEYTRFDVALDLREDGSLHVTETLVLAFYAGPYESWQREVPVTRMDGLRNVAVREQTFGDRPYANRGQDAASLTPGTYTWQPVDGAVAIQWRFDPVTSAQRIFVVDYDVVGALRVYPAATPPTQQIWWTAVDAALSAATPVKASEVTIRLPRVVELATVSVGHDGEDDPADHSSDGRVFTWQTGRIAAGDTFEIRLAFPPVAAGAVQPAWQAADDAREAGEVARRDRRALLDVLFLGVGLLLLTGGGVGLFGLWYARGRDPHTGLAADILTQPPDDLPPGAAGALLDERADHCDVVATLVDLGRRGVVAIAEVVVPSGAFGTPRRDFDLTLTQPEAPVASFEAELLRALFGPDLTRPWQPKLSEVHQRFARAQPRIKDHLYAELVDRRYFARSPEATRTRWRNNGLAGLAASMVVGLGIGVGFGGLAWFPAIVAPGLPLAILGVSRSMPRKSNEGAEAVARWRAFRRYLASIERYDRIAEAGQIFDRYLPYAVAFGLDRSWVAAFASAGTTTPSWYLGRRGARQDVGGLGRSSGHWGLGDVSAPALPDVDLQQASDLAGAALQASSDGLAALFDAAGKAFESFDIDL